MLIFLSAVWLIGCWLVAIGVRPPLQPSSASYEPQVRIMLLCLTSGFMIGWPLLRLSQSPSRAPGRQTLLDLLVLISMLQVVLWPVRLVTTWSVLRTAAIDATMAGWLLLAGAMVAAGSGSVQPGPRTLAMLGCLGLCFLGPILAVLGLMSGIDAMGLIELSPLMAMLTLGDGGSSPITRTQWSWVVLLHGSAAAVWLSYLVWSIWSGRSSSRSERGIMTRKGAAQGR